MRKSEQVKKINTSYQDEDEAHALPPHFFNQLRKVREVLIKHKVQLPFHVVNICILHILLGTKSHNKHSFIPGEPVLLVYLNAYVDILDLTCYENLNGDYFENGIIQYLHKEY